MPLGLPRLGRCLGASAGFQPVHAGVVLDRAASIEDVVLLPVAGSPGLGDRDRRHQEPAASHQLLFPSPLELGLQIHGAD